MRHHITPLRMAFRKRNKRWQICGEKEALCAQLVGM